MEGSRGNAPTDRDRHSHGHNKRHRNDNVGRDLSRDRDEYRNYREGYPRQVEQRESSASRPRSPTTKPTEPLGAGLTPNKSNQSRSNTPAPSSQVANPVLQEVLKAAVQARLKSQQAGQADKLEASILEPDSKKPKHSPIVWRTPHKNEEPEEQNVSKQSAKPQTFTDRAAQELREFSELCVEADLPPARKASPSYSESSQESDHADTRQGASSEQEDGEYRATKSGVTSRWQLEEGEGEEVDTNKAAAGADVKHNIEPASSDSMDEDEEDGAKPTAVDGPQAIELDGALSLDQNGIQAVQPTRYINMLEECRRVEEFERLNRISEGTYGVVYRAREKKSGNICALKRVKMDRERDGFPLTSIREINILLNFHHPNIVNVNEVVVGASLDQIFMVMEFMEHDLKALMDDQMTQPFSVAEVKCLMQQLLEGVAYLHDNWVLHRDLKTSNILYNNLGDLKICDFGLARQYGSPLKPYTSLVVTLWYRAPELLFGTTLYSTAVDMWSVGCIMGELLTGKPLFNGQSEFEQIDKICALMGTPNEEVWPGFSKLSVAQKIKLKQMPFSLRSKFQSFVGGGTMLTDAGFDLLSSLLAYDPERRISAKDALAHKWFHEHPLPQKKELMPTFRTTKDGTAPVRSRPGIGPSPSGIDIAHQAAIQFSFK